MLVAAMLFAVSANAQFEKDKLYVGGSLTGLNLSYSGSTDLNLGLQAHAGYMIEDDMMVLANVELQHNNRSGSHDSFVAGRSEEHTSELQSRQYLVCRLLLEKKNEP